MPRAYTSAKLTLTTASTVYNLYTLLSAIESDCQIRACEVSFQADDANVHTVFIGDRSLSTNRYGYELWPLQISSGGPGFGRPLQLRHDRNIFTLKDINMMALTGSQYVLVNIWTA